MKRLLLAPLILGSFSPVNAQDLDQVMENCLAQGKDKCAGIMMGSAICTAKKAGPIDVKKINSFYENVLKGLGIDEAEDLAPRGFYSPVTMFKAVQTFENHCGIAPAEIKNYDDVLRIGLSKERSANHVCPYFAVREMKAKDELKERYPMLEQPKGLSALRDCIFAFTGKDLDED